MLAGKLKTMGGALLTATLWATTGCGPSATSICERTDECVGLSESQFDDCVDEIEDLERDAEREDCLEEYDEALACADETFDCDNDHVEFDCSDENEDLGRCLN